MIECCNEEIVWHHCKKCGGRKIEFPHSKETNVIASLLVDYVDDYDVGWTTLENIIHELWKQGHYEGYEPKVPDRWNTSIEQKKSE